MPNTYHPALITYYSDNHNNIHTKIKEGILIYRDIKNTIDWLALFDLKVSWWSLQTLFESICQSYMV